MFHAMETATGRCLFEGKSARGEKDGLILTFDRKGVLRDGMYCWACVRKISEMLSGNGRADDEIRDGTPVIDKAAQ
jgi:hypothetical protein